MTVKPVVYAAGGNPYGTSLVNGDGSDATALEAARYQGRRLARITMRLLEDGRVTDGGDARETIAATTSRTS
ncbi:hypothetical protein [Nonomuraea sp. B1E8]|uniref:hypothetical protein n=1 Tax=unclassified Nonomuraea TaxID=2593643 RepID=UPI00325DE7A1